jgi:hypothetical protein
MADHHGAASNPILTHSHEAASELTEATMRQSREGRLAGRGTLEERWAYPRPATRLLQPSSRRCTEDAPRLGTH